MILAYQKLRNNLFRENESLAFLIECNKMILNLS